MNNVGARVDLHDAISIRYQSGATVFSAGASCPSQAGIGDIPDEPWPRHQLQVRFYGSEGQLIVDLERTSCGTSARTGWTTSPTFRPMPASTSATARPTP